MIDKENLLEALNMLIKEAKEENEIEVAACLTAIMISIISGIFDKKEDDKND